MITIGGRVYSLGVIALGIVVLAFGEISPDWLPVPAHLPGRAVLAYGAGAALVVAGALISATRTRMISTLTVAGLFAAGMLVFEAPHAVARPADWAGWQAIAESVAMALGAMLVYVQSPGVGVARDTVARAARLGFGLCLLVFGGSHFVYASYTTSLVPAWLPPSQLAWTYVTGVAQIAAGLAMLSGILARLAAILLTLMYAAFSALVHIPSIVAHPASHANWAENAINLVLIGAAWSLADSLSRASRR